MRTEPPFASSAPPISRTASPPGPSSPTMAPRDRRLMSSAPLLAEPSPTGTRSFPPTSNRPTKAPRSRGATPRQEGPHTMTDDPYYGWQPTLQRRVNTINHELGTALRLDANAQGVFLVDDETGK